MCHHCKPSPRMRRLRERERDSERERESAPAFAAFATLSFHVVARFECREVSTRNSASVTQHRELFGLRCLGSGHCSLSFSPSLSLSSSLSPSLSLFLSFSLSLSLFLSFSLFRSLSLSHTFPLSLSCEMDSWFLGGEGKEGGTGRGGNGWL